MRKPNPRIAYASGVLGAAIRDRRSPEEIARLEKELRALQLASHVEKTLQKFGPFTPEQIARVAALLAEAV